MSCTHETVRISVCLVLRICVCVYVSCYLLVSSMIVFRTKSQPHTGKRRVGHIHTAGLSRVASSLKGIASFNGLIRCTSRLIALLVQRLLVRNLWPALSGKAGFVPSFSNIWHLSCCVFNLGGGQPYFAVVFMLRVRLYLLVELADCFQSSNTFLTLHTWFPSLFSLLWLVALTSCPCKDGRLCHSSRSALCKRRDLACHDCHV